MDKLTVKETMEVTDAQGNVTMEASTTSHQMKLADVIKAELAQLESKRIMLEAQLNEIV